MISLHISMKVIYKYNMDDSNNKINISNINKLSKSGFHQTEEILLAIADIYDLIDNDENNTEGSDNL